MLDEHSRLKEDHHFRERDRELIAKLRAKADEERRQRERAHRKQLHWMKCPKCGHDLKEVEKGPLFVDLCSECGGLYLDAGELEILLTLERDTSLLGRLFGRKSGAER